MRDDELVKEGERLLERCRQADERRDLSGSRGPIARCSKQATVP